MLPLKTISVSVRSLDTLHSPLGDGEAIQGCAIRAGDDMKTVGVISGHSMEVCNDRSLAVVIIDVAAQDGEVEGRVALVELVSVPRKPP